MTDKTKDKKGDQSSEESEDFDFDVQQNIKDFPEREIQMENGSLWSTVMVSWPTRLMDVFNKNKKITLEDLGGLQDEYKIEAKVDDLKDNYDHYKSMPKAIMWTYRREFALRYFIQIIECIMEYTSPIASNLLLNFLEEGNPDTMWGVKLAAIQVFWGVFTFLFNEHFGKLRHRVGCSARWVMGAMMFDKHIRLTPSTSKQFTTDQINRVLHREIHQVWYLNGENFEVVKIPFKLAISGYYLYSILGISFLSGGVLTLVTMGIQHLINKMTENSRLARQHFSEKRGSLTSETIHNIKTIKFYQW